MAYYAVPEPYQPKSCFFRRCSLRLDRRRNFLTLDNKNQLHTGLRRIKCLLGTGGKAEKKIEGDGISPEGVFPLRGVFYRADRTARPLTRLNSYAVCPRACWCDDIHAKSFYNRFLFRPTRFCHETLWRKDRLYDLIIVVGFNDQPAVPNKGSAIFIHNQPNPSSPSAGCLTLAPADLRALMPLLNHNTLLLTKPLSPLDRFSKRRRFSCREKSFVLFPKTIER